MKLRVIEGEFSICQVASAAEASVLLDQPFCFVGKTDGELSVVCPSAAAPEGALKRDDGWGMFGVVGSMDFSLVGILAGMSATLAEAGVGIFAVSTYDTDYILVKAADLDRAVEALSQAGHEF